MGLAQDGRVEGCELTPLLVRAPKSQLTVEQLLTKKKKKLDATPPPQKKALYIQMKAIGHNEMVGGVKS